MPNQPSVVGARSGSVHRWPLLLGGLFMAFLLFSCWSIMQAGAKGSPVVDPDYYASGQAYHEDERAWRAAGEAGWRLLLAKEDETLQVRLVDGGGRPVSGGTVIVRASRRSAGHPVSWQLTLPETAPGVYRAPVVNFPAEAGALVLSATTAEAELQRRFRVNGRQWRELAL